MDNENRDLTAVHPQMKKVVSLESFVFIGLFICFSGRGGNRKSDYVGATWTFISMCAVAFGLALIAALKGQEAADTVAEQIVIR